MFLSRLATGISRTADNLDFKKPGDDVLSEPESSARGGARV
jgi:hypothetical protein